MAKVIDYMSERDGFISCLAGGRFIGGINSRTMRRAAERKRRIEAKKRKKTATAKK